MKKYLSLMLLCAAVFFSSCEKESPAEEIAGIYVFHETGYLTINNQLLPWEVDGKFAATKTGYGSLTFTGDFTGEAIVYNDYTMSIMSDASDFTSEGINYHFENSYSNAHYSNGDHYLSWKTNAIVKATYQGQTLYGSLESYTSAKKQ